MTDEVQRFSINDGLMTCEVVFAKDHDRVVANKDQQIRQLTAEIERLTVELRHAQGQLMRAQAAYANSTEHYLDDELRHKAMVELDRHNKQLQADLNEMRRQLAYYQACDTASQQDITKLQADLAAYQRELKQWKTSTLIPESRLGECQRQLQLEQFKNMDECSRATDLEKQLAACRAELESR